MSSAMQIALFAAFSVSIMAGQPQATVTVKELPPEEIPLGTCTTSMSGYLGIVGADKKERTSLSALEIGNYVKKKLAEGYSVALYPQASGKIFVAATCHPAKP